MESGPEDKSSTKYIRRKLKMLSPLCSSYAPRSSSPLMRTVHRVIGLLQWKGRFWVNFFFFFSTPLTCTSKSGVHCVRHLYPDKGQLSLFRQKVKFLTRLKHLAASVLKMPQSSVWEKYYPPSLSRRSVAFMFWAYCMSNQLHPHTVEDKRCTTHSDSI